MTDFTIGQMVKSNLAWVGGGYTAVSTANPATGAGRINYVEIRVSNWATAICKVGSIIGLPPTPRDYVDLGEVAAGSLQTFSGLDIECELRDQIACYHTSAHPIYPSYLGSRSVDVGAGGARKGAGDLFAGDAIAWQTFTDIVHCLYGCGSEPSPDGWFGIVNGVSGISLSHFLGVNSSNLKKAIGI
jgi:hypothetical protein